MVEIKKKKKKRNCGIILSHDLAAINSKYDHQQKIRILSKSYLIHLQNMLYTFTLFTNNLAYLNMFC